MANIWSQTRRIMYSSIFTQASVGSILALLLFPITTFANPIAIENSLPGTPFALLDLEGTGSENIQGFATKMSVLPGESIDFKVATQSDSYYIDIYRLGYYGGIGGRLIASFSPSVSLPQSQPPCLEDASTGLIDCGNWATSASWTVPADATSGVYIANFVQ